jgi:hypothetical protein
MGTAPLGKQDYTAEHIWYRQLGIADYHTGHDESATPFLRGRTWSDNPAKWNDEVQDRESVYSERFIKQTASLEANQAWTVTFSSLSGSVCNAV